MPLLILRELSLHSILLIDNLFQPIITRFLSCLDFCGNYTHTFVHHVFAVVPLKVLDVISDWHLLSITLIICYHFYCERRLLFELLGQIVINLLISFTGCIKSLVKLSERVHHFHQLINRSYLKLALLDL